MHRTIFTNIEKISSHNNNSEIQHVTADSADNEGADSDDSIDSNTTTDTTHCSQSELSEKSFDTLSQEFRPASPATASASESPTPSTSSGSGMFMLLPNKRQKTIVQTFRTLASYNEGGPKNVRITNAILFFICRDYQPISVVENEGFQNLVKLLTGGLYKIPSRKTINSLIEKKYEAVSSLFREKIKHVPSYTLTTDIWTETLQTRSYLGVTLHFAENYETESVTLGVIELSERHTAEYITDQLNLVMDNWSLEKEKVAAIITDGAKNISKAAETLFGKKKHLHCFAHQINLVAERGIASCENLTNLIKKMKDIITWFKQSANASDDLRKFQDSENIKKLIQQVPTRWNSTYYSISRFLELREIINQIVNRYPSAPSMINAREAQMLIEVQKVLLPLEAATKQMSGEKYTTSSVVIPMICNIKTSIQETLPESDVAKQLKEALLNECSKRFGSAEQVYLLAVSTVLDPRFKKIYFSCPLNCGRAVQDVQDEMFEQNQHDVMDCDPSVELSASRNEGTSGKQSLLQFKYILLTSLLFDFQSCHALHLIYGEHTRKCSRKIKRHMKNRQTPRN